jgi:hypothetical protein
VDSGEVSRSSAQVGDDAYLHQNIAFSGVFTPVLAKHTKHLSLVDILPVGVDRMQRNFEPMRKQVEAWKAARLPDETAKLVVCRAFVEGALDVPKHLARRDLYFNPQIEEFAPRTTVSVRGSTRLTC